MPRERWPLRSGTVPVQNDSDVVQVPVRIPSGGWTFTIVDSEDEALARSRPLTLHSHGYARMGRLYLHRLILQPGPGLLTDHVNRHRLDNRRSNLREATPLDSQANRGKDRRGQLLSSRFRGVHRHSTSPVWVAQITRKGRTAHLGCFDTEEAAADAYNAAARDLQGAFANLNEGTVPGEKRLMMRCPVCNAFVSVRETCRVCR